MRQYEARKEYEWEQRKKKWEDEFASLEVIPPDQLPKDDDDDSLKEEEDDDDEDYYQVDDYDDI